MAKTVRATKAAKTPAPTKVAEKPPRCPGDHLYRTITHSTWNRPALYCERCGRLVLLPVSVTGA